MAIGDEAAGQGYPLVPTSGDLGKVRLGAQEINRTRDFVAQVKKLTLPIWPVLRGGTGATTALGARNNLGIRSGTGAPTGGVDGDVYFRII